MLLKATDTLYAGETYTFTFAHGKVVELNRDDYILGDLRARLKDNYGEVLSVERPLFSSHYVVTVIPKVSRILGEWIQKGFGFNDAWSKMGYPNAVFIQAEGGERSSKAGGLSQVVPTITGQVAQVASETITSVVRPLFLPIVAGVAIFLFVKLKK